MYNKLVKERFKEIVESENKVCTELELQDFIKVGLIKEINGKLYNKNGIKYDKNIIYNDKHNMNINLSKLLNQCEQLAREFNTNKIYFIIKKTYNNYMEKGYIVNIKGNDYYKFFENEFWLVNMI